MRENDKRQAVAIDSAILRSHHRDGAERNRRGFIDARIPDRDRDRRTACVSRYTEKLETSCGGGSTHNDCKEKSDNVAPYCVSAALCHALIVELPPLSKMPRHSSIDSGKCPPWVNSCRSNCASLRLLFRNARPRADRRLPAKLGRPSGGYEIPGQNTGREPGEASQVYPRQRACEAFQASSPWGQFQTLPSLP